MHIISKSEDETKNLAKDLAPYLQSGDVVFLQGALGAGKSVFARALIRALSENEELDVPSPTFTLVQTYETDKNTIWHFDLYRLEDAEEIYELDWEDAVTDGIVLVEWPERLDFLAPSTHLDIVMTSLEETTREITMTPHGTYRKDWEIYA